jgi:hypothetical protein
LGRWFGTMGTWLRELVFASHSEANRSIPAAARE